MTEQIYSAAYGASSPMGRPLYCADASTDEVMAFRDRGYGLNGAILSATGITNHTEFCEKVDSLLTESPPGDSSTPTTILYMGGESRLSAPSIGQAHVALAFHVRGSSAIRCILKHCFGRIGREHGVSTFETGGLVGVYGSSPTENSSSIEASLTETLITKLTPEIISKAITLAKAEAAFDLDCGSSQLAAAMTNAVMETGGFIDSATVGMAFDSISDADVSEAAALMLKSNPSLAAVGDISLVPYQGTFASRF